MNKSPSIRPARAGKLLCQHLMIFGGVAVYLFVFGQCVIRWFTGISCPGCGLTRATLAALRLDVAAAFRLHPLFWLATPFLLYVIHRQAWHLPGNRRSDRWLSVLVGVAFFGVYLVRLLWLPDEVVNLDFQQSVLYKLWAALQSWF